MFGGAKKWSERSIKKKLCRVCYNLFQPTCGGNIFCKTCGIKTKRENHAKGQREWRSKNPERHRALKSNWDLRKKYGISLDKYEEMLGLQNNACAICNDTNPKGRGVHRKFSVDHDHKTGKIRGLLCGHCNTGIGLFKENQEFLTRAAKYLEGREK